MESYDERSPTGASGRFAGSSDVVFRMVGLSVPQRFHKSLIKEYTLNHNLDLYMFQGGILHEEHFQGLLGPHCQSKSPGGGGGQRQDRLCQRAHPVAEAEKGTSKGPAQAVNEVLIWNTPRVQLPNYLRNQVCQKP